MNKQQATLESLKQQMAALQEKIEAFESTEEEQGKKENPWALVEEHGWGYMVDLATDYTVAEAQRIDTRDINTFKEKSVAQGFANAFHVMVALRQCEGAGQFDGYASGWTIDDTESIDWSHSRSVVFFSVFPPFPSEELAIAAADKVGRDKIAAAYKFLATGK